MEAVILMVSMMLLALVMWLLERVLTHNEIRSRRSQSIGIASQLQHDSLNSENWVITESEAGDSDQERLVSQIMGEAPGGEVVSDSVLPAASGIYD